jgi:hypothetical protein
MWTSIWTHSLAFLAGALVAVPWTRVVLATAARDAKRAALYAVATSLIASIDVQLWAGMEFSFTIFVAGALGDGVGTYWEVRRGA